jgi:hypothetical protein
MRAYFEDAPEWAVRDSSPTGSSSPGRPYKRCSDSYSANNRLVAYLKENKKKKKCIYNLIAFLIGMHVEWDYYVLGLWIEFAFSIGPGYI